MKLARKDAENLWNKKVIAETFKNLDGAKVYRVFMSLTEGQSIALVNALKAYGEHSPVGRDLSILLDKALNDL